MPKTLCIYQADNADDLLAAWAVHKALGPEVEFMEAKPGDSPPNIRGEECNRCFGSGYLGPAAYAECQFCNGSGYISPGRDLLILGHLYPLEVLRAMAREARSVLVIVHHETAPEDLQEISNYYALYGDSGYSGYRLKAHYAPHALSAILDQSRSTAGIAWDYLHSNKQPHCDCGDSGICKVECPRYEQKMRAQPARPRIIDLIEDWSLGRFKFDETRAFHAVLASYDWTDLEGMFKRLDEWYCYSDMVANLGPGSSDEPRDHMLCDGRAVRRAQAQAARFVLASRGTIKIAGHTVPCANVPPSMASEAGRLLCETLITTTGYDRADGDHSNKLAVKPASAFSATYHDDLAAGRRRFTLHSPEGGADVGEIAKQYAEKFNLRAAYPKIVEDLRFKQVTWTASGTARSATFDAPLGWQGE